MLIESTPFAVVLCQISFGVIREKYCDGVASIDKEGIRDIIGLEIVILLCQKAVRYNINAGGLTDCSKIEFVPRLGFGDVLENRINLGSKLCARSIAVFVATDTDARSSSPARRLAHSSATSARRRERPSINDVVAK